MIATTPTGGTLPTLCGTLTGQHSKDYFNTAFEDVFSLSQFAVFLETGSSGTAGTLALTFGANAATRTASIKATYYQCSSLNRSENP